MFTAGLCRYLKTKGWDTFSSVFLNKEILYPTRSIVVLYCWHNIAMRVLFLTMNKNSNEHK